MPSPQGFRLDPEQGLIKEKKRKKIQQKKNTNQWGINWRSVVD